MRAVVYQRYGPPEVLMFREVPRPEPGDHEVLIRVRAVEVTKADCELRAGRFPVKWFWLPLRLAIGLRRPRRQILGCYFAGEIEAVGAKVADRQPGEAVMVCGGLRMGGYGEFACVPARYTMARVPPNTGFAHAAAVPLGGLNALHFFRRADVQPGELVLVNGAGGSIGAHFLQLAADRGAVVTAVDAPHKESMVRELGADHFIDYTAEDFADAGPYDVVFSTVAAASFARCAGALKPGGRYVMANPKLSDMLRSPFLRSAGRRAIFAFARETPGELEELRTLIEAGRLRSIVDRVLPAEQAVAGHRLVESEERKGAIVLTFDAAQPDAGGSPRSRRKR